MEKRNTKKEVTINGINEMHLKGRVTFVNDTNEKCIVFGMDIPRNTESGKVAHTFLNVKAFPSVLDDNVYNKLMDVKKDVTVEIDAHFISSKYKDAFQLDIILDDLIVS